MFSIAASAASEAKNFAELKAVRRNQGTKKVSSKYTKSRNAGVPKLSTVVEGENFSSNASDASIFSSSNNSDSFRSRRGSLHRAANSLMTAPAKALSSMFSTRKNLSRGLLSKQSNAAFDRQGLTRQLSSNSLFSMPSLATMKQNDFPNDAFSEMDSIYSEDMYSVIDFDDTLSESHFPNAVIHPDDFRTTIEGPIPFSSLKSREGCYIDILESALVANVDTAKGCSRWEGSVAQQEVNVIQTKTEGFDLDPNSCIAKEITNAEEQETSDRSRRTLNSSSHNAKDTVPTYSRRVVDSDGDIDSDSDSFLSDVGNNAHSLSASESSDDSSSSTSANKDTLPICSLRLTSPTVPPTMAASRSDAAPVIPRRNVDDRGSSELMPIWSVCTSAVAQKGGPRSLARAA